MKRGSTGARLTFDGIQSKGKRKTTNLTTIKPKIQKVWVKKEKEEDLDDVINFLGLDEIDYDEEDEEGEIEAPKTTYNKKDKMVWTAEQQKEITARVAKEWENYSTDNEYDFSDFDLFEEEKHKPLRESDWAEFFHMHSSWKYVESEGVILRFNGTLWGTNESLYGSVTGFKPNFYIRLPEGWGPTEISKFLESLNMVVKTKYPWQSFDKHIVSKLATLYPSSEMAEAGDLVDYKGDKKAKMIKIISNYPRAVAAARKVLNDPSKYMWNYRNAVFHVYEADIDFTQRFFYDAGMEPSRWYSIPPHKFEINQNKNRGSTCKYEIKCHYKDLQMHVNREKKDEKDNKYDFCQTCQASCKYDKIFPNWRIVSYDTEQLNKPFRFPVKRVHPLIVFSANVFGFTNPEKSANVLLVYAKDGWIPESIRAALPAEGGKLKKDVKHPLTNCDYFYWFKSEPGFLAHMKKFNFKVDPDGYIDYNGANFDLPTIMSNGELFWGQDYRIWGRDKYQKVREHSHPWRGKTTYTFTIPGRFTIDMLKIIKGAQLPPDLQPKNFTLEEVCRVMLDETKVAFDVNLMEAKWNHPEDRKDIWIYGDQDAKLPKGLCNKLNIIPTYIGMSRTTNISFQQAIDRGAGSKIEGFLRKLCIEDTKDLILFENVIKQIGLDNGDKNLINQCAKDVEGACVIEPLTGYHEGVIFLLDFMSMYPSIIELLNTCLSTHLTRAVRTALGINIASYWSLPKYHYVNDEIFIEFQEFGPTFVRPHVREGLLPKAERILGAWRRKVKDDIKKLDAQLRGDKNNKGLDSLLADLENSGITKEQIKEISDLSSQIGKLKKQTQSGPVLEEIITKNAILTELKKERDSKLTTEQQKEVKELKDKITKIRFEKMVLDGLQMSIKILMNGIFGQTIFKLSKFYMRDIGETILTFAKYMLNYVKCFVNTTYTIENGCDFTLLVLYGDTVKKKVLFFSI
jgi:DNA polymerase elongation subunit (family B)